MQTTMNKYYNFKQGVTAKPKLLTLAEIKRLKIPQNQDAYLSIFRYNEDHKKKVDLSGSLAGIKDVVTNTLVWDFDDALNPENARKDTVTLGNRLVNEYYVSPEDISCYWTGNKGFHVILSLNHDINPEQFKQATGLLAKDLVTFDTVVSDPQRVLRIEYTKNQKSGLYKIPLHIAEVDELNINQIKGLAATAREDYEHTANPISLPPILFDVPVTKTTIPIMSNEDYDYSKPAKGWKIYKYALAQGWFESGERHQALMVIAATCRGLGYDKDLAYSICRSAVRKQARRTGETEFTKEELYENIIEKSVFADNWAGGQYSPSNNPWLKKYCEKMGFATVEIEDQVIQLDHMEASFTDYVQNIEKNTILTGIPCLDRALPLTIGMNLGLVGSASSGKTAIALNILKNTSESGVVSVFASLDMHRNRLFEKLLYKVSGLSREDLYAKIKSGDAKPIFDKVREEYKNVYFYDRSRPTVSDIRQYILKVEEQTGKKVKLVMLDYFERVNSEKSEDTAASKDISGQLQDLVNDFNVCMITLVQPNKFALSGGPDTPILNYTAIKGSSFLYQSFRSIISIWRPFFNPEWATHDKFMQMAILKNDLGELDLFSFGWNGKKGDIWELTEEGIEELARLQKLKQQAYVAHEEENKGWR